jgi:hypothetical protein
MAGIADVHPLVWNCWLPAHKERHAPAQQQKMTHAELERHLLDHVWKTSAEHELQHAKPTMLSSPTLQVVCILHISSMATSASTLPCTQTLKTMLSNVGVTCV